MEHDGALWSTLATPFVETTLSTSLKTTLSTTSSSFRKDHLVYDLVFVSDSLTVCRSSSEDQEHFFTSRSSRSSRSLSSSSRSSSASGRPPPARLTITSRISSTRTTLGMRRDSASQPCWSMIRSNSWPTTAAMSYTSITVRSATFFSRAEPGSSMAGPSRTSSRWTDGPVKVQRNSSAGTLNYRRVARLSALKDTVSVVSPSLTSPGR
ncbi:hypothetical protein EYF80_050280 [Liparis tanakae]|uniref:Uncharacterized protein n=1 Tax=Liparis tanakae TaxID=230148 RepID=A0A4Z2FEI9_9TELE|nr:hypothetical protein EYF80_050280 [Liparis tanakae]